MLHRDVKPSNVRVTPKGRVVLLDFGLATHLSGGKQTSEAAAVGTVEYMAPEQANAQKLTPAADWYSLGVLLYEALTGQRPFNGAPMQLLMAKHQGVFAPPGQLVPGIAADLEAVCLGLLKPKPDERLDGDGVLALLGSGSSLPSPSTNRARGEEEPVGRSAELAELQATLERALGTGIGLTLIEGESGIGKSALAQHFARSLAVDYPDMLVLAGRCHAAEQVGYKAFDGVVDDLSRFLKALPTADSHAFLPEDAHLLAVLFPVLDGVPAIARAKRDAALDRVERYPLFQAFMELLRRIGRTRPLLLVVDDLQWADEASLVLLRTLLDSSRAPRLYIAATVRPLAVLDDAVGEGLRALSTHERVTRLSLGPLAEAETRTLVARLCREPEDASVVARLARDAQGHPLFVQELVRHAVEGSGDVRQSGLDAAIRSRVEKLDLVTRTVLELSAVASAPLTYTVLRAAASAHAEQLREALAALRVQKLLHSVRRNETIIYHDRIREAVLRMLPVERVSAYHRRLAEAWSDEPNAEPERLALHWLGCDEKHRAAPFLAQAAKKAEQGGAFERAVEHYRTLLGLEDVVHERSQVHALRLALSDSLASAGRCAESARVLLRAIDGASQEEALELTVRAAQRLLQAAEIEEGLAAAERAFGLLGLSWPKSRLGIAASILWNRALLALRGFDVQAPQQGRITEQQRRELDALWRLQLPITWADLLRCAAIVGLYARLAIASGEAGHAAHALCGDAALKSVRGGSPSEVAETFAKARACRMRANRSELEAYEEWTLGSHAFFNSSLKESEAHFERAEALYATCTGAAWEQTNARGLILLVSSLRGRLKRHAALTEAWLADVDLRGDRFARIMYVTQGYGSLRHLLADAPEGGLREVAESIAAWRTQGRGGLEVMEAIAGGWLLTYPGAKGVRTFWSERWSRLQKGFYFRMPAYRDVLLYQRLLSSLPDAYAGDEAALRDLRPLATSLQKGRSAWAGSVGIFTRAQVAWLNGDREETVRMAREAGEVLSAKGVDLYAPFAALLAARAANAPDAHDREQRIIDWLADEGFVRPDKALLWLLPAAVTWRCPPASGAR